MGKLKKILSFFGYRARSKGPNIPDSKNLTNSFDTVTDVKHFALLKEGDRITNVMRIGDSGQQDGLEIMEYALSQDQSTGVRFAALKRVHNFSENAEIVRLVQGLPAKFTRSELEPYHSMALFRLRLITQVN